MPPAGKLPSLHQTQTEIPNGLTAVTVAPNGSIFAGMGYGSQKIHKFDATGKLIKSFAKNSDLCVQDWNSTGRVTKLRRK